MYTLKSFDSLPCHYYQDIRHFYHLQSVPFCPFPFQGSGNHWHSFCSQMLYPWAIPANMHSVAWDETELSCEIHVSGLMQTLLICVMPPSLSIIVWDSFMLLLIPAALLLSFGCPTLSFPCCVHKPILYVCISMSAQEEGSSVASFWIPYACVTMQNLSFSFWLNISLYNRLWVYPPH